MARILGFIVGGRARADSRYARPTHNALSRSERIARAEKVAGIIVVSRQLPVSQVINDLEIIVSCSDMIEWENIVSTYPSSSEAGAGLS